MPSCCNPDTILDLTKGLKLDIERINARNRENADALIAQSEAFYHDQLTTICEYIQRNHTRHKLVLLAGPSGSGKTTTAHKLCEILGSAGIKAFTISLDNFFKNREDLPFLEDGMRDYESPATLDTDEITRCFDEILSRGESNLPVFDFVKGERSRQQIAVSVKNGEIIFMEGIHALNPSLSHTSYQDTILKLYISTKSEFVKNDAVLLRSQDLRLVRRIIRDYHFRGSSPQNTMDMWGHVCLGEENYIKPYRDTADVWINSVHRYEPLVYRNVFGCLMKQVDRDSRHYSKMLELFNTLEQFDEIDVQNVPKGSLLWEFLA